MLNQVDLVSGRSLIYVSFRFGSEESNALSLLFNLFALQQSWQAQDATDVFNEACRPKITQVLINVFASAEKHLVCTLTR